MSPYRRAFSAMTTWQSQNGVLAVAFIWGLSYTMNPAWRIKFSEVFPPSLAQFSLMWVWGYLLCVPAAVSLLGDAILRQTRGHAPSGYWMALAGHWVLSCVYCSLVFFALIDGMREVRWDLFTSHPAVWFAGFISSLSRPALWWFITYWHTKFARLPIPSPEELDVGADIGDHESA